MYRVAYMRTLILKHKLSYFGDIRCAENESLEKLTTLGMIEGRRGTGRPCICLGVYHYKSVVQHSPSGSVDFKHSNKTVDKEGLGARQAIGPGTHHR